jgi:hypothetical protein
MAIRIALLMAVTRFIRVAGPSGSCATKPSRSGTATAVDMALARTRCDTARALRRARATAIDVGCTLDLFSQLLSHSQSYLN